MPKKLSQQAIDECVRELLSACRMPIKSGAVAQLVKQLAPKFKELLDVDAGPQVWARTGPLMRDNGRFIGTLAEFIANRQRKTRVEEDDVMMAFQLVREKCRAIRPPTGVPEFIIYCLPVAAATAAQKALLKSLLPSG